MVCAESPLGQEAIAANLDEGVFGAGQEIETKPLRGQSSGGHLYRNIHHLRTLGENGDLADLRGVILHGDCCLLFTHLKEQYDPSSQEYQVLCFLYCMNSKYKA